MIEQIWRGAPYAGLKFGVGENNTILRRFTP
jgi:hypothetical protein